MSEEEEDLAVLIYKSSKTAKARAAAAAAAKEKKDNCFICRTSNFNSKEIFYESRRGKCHEETCKKEMLC